VQTCGVIDLIGVAAADGFVDLTDMLEIIGFGYGESGSGNTCLKAV
jgi:hypothetical protein